MTSGLTGRAAIDRADDPVHLDASVRADRDLGHLRDIGAERLVHGDAARRGPRGSGVPQPAFSAASSSTALWRGCFVEQRAAERDRVLARRVRPARR